VAGYITWPLVCEQAAADARIRSVNAALDGCKDCGTLDILCISSGHRCKDTVVVLRDAVCELIMSGGRPGASVSQCRLSLRLIALN